MECSNNYFLDRKFDPLKFYEQYYEYEPDNMDDITERLYQIYKSDKLKGNSLLDLGTGPSLHWLAAASQKYTDITLSDLAEENVITLNNWIEKAPDAKNLTNLKYAAKVENISDHTIIEERIRKAAKLAVPCDLLNEIPLLNINRQYDVIQCTFAADSAARDYNSLKGVIQNMSNHLKPGGALVMVNTLGATYWAVGPHKYPKITLSKEALEDALTDVGFEDIQFNVYSRGQNSQRPCDYKAYICSCAFKKL